MIGVTARSVNFDSAIEIAKFTSSREMACQYVNPEKTVHYPLTIPRPLLPRMPR